MATYRIGIGTEFKLDGGVGIGTDTAPSGLGDLKVEGTIKTIDLDVTGVSAFARYAGFTADNLEIGKDGRDTTLTGEHQTTSDIVVGVNSTFTVSTGATVCTSSVESISLTDHFSPPCGGVEDREECPVEGTVRFNKDLNTLEFYNGVDWRQFTVNGASGRGYFAGGRTPASGSIAETKKIDIVQISTLGNAINFGELSNTRRNHAHCSSSIRGLCISGSYNGSPSNSIDYFTLALEGIAVDFGDATASDQGESAVASSTRGVHATGNPSNKTIDYVEIATLGNALDFGDRVISLDEHGAIGSATRGLFCGGGAPSGSAPNATMQLITIASKGDATTFGDLTQTKGQLGGGVSDGVRGAVAGGYGSPAQKKSIDYITFASEGNATPFGDLITGRGEQAGASSNRTRGLFAGGYSGGYLNSIEYITMSTTGNAQDFGDLTALTERIGGGQISDSHGGLGGY